MLRTHKHRVGRVGTYPGPPDSDPEPEPEPEPDTDAAAATQHLRQGEATDESLRCFISLRPATGINTFRPHIPRPPPLAASSEHHLPALRALLRLLPFVCIFHLFFPARRQPAHRGPLSMLLPPSAANFLTRQPRSHHQHHHFGFRDILLLNGIRLLATLCCLSPLFVLLCVVCCASRPGPVYTVRQRTQGGLRCKRLALPACCAPTASSPHPPRCFAIQL